MRIWWVVLVAACWTSSPKPPEQVEAVGVSDERTCSTETFDPSNAACESFCMRTAPQGWPGCTRLADELIAKGYTCTRPTPYACQPPPPATVTCPPNGCAPVHTRLIAISIMGNAIEVKFAAGANHGITLAWTAKLVDANNHPIPGGDITLVRVDKHVTVGTLASTIQPTSAFVLVSP